MVKNNLYMVEKNLRSIAKRYKGIKYSLGLAILFLMMGLSAFSQDVMSTEEIAASKENLAASVETLQNKVEAARKENQKAIDGLRLELIQLMEQGDQVVKSPWASWQFGANYMYNDWRGTYKGRGDKAEKYPYEGVLTRESGANEFNRYVAENSPMYSYLSKGNDPTSASSSLRGKTNGYGLASNTTIPENPVSFTVTASIKPRIVTKGAINVTPPEEISPTLPKAIDFKPVTPEIVVPSPDPITVNVPVPPGTGNGDGTWIQQNGSVGAFHQVNVDGGKIDVNVNNNTFDVSVANSKLIGESGSTHSKTYYTTLDNPTATTNVTGNSTGPAVPLTFSLTGNTSPYAVMKLVGGQEINIDNAEINFSGTGPTNYRKWLFHTDGHNDYGESTWVLNEGTKVTVNGSNLVVYTAQYHSGTSQNANVGFVNKGTITTTGSNNYLWMTMADGGNKKRSMYFDNQGTIKMGGTGDVFALLNAENETDGGFSFLNTGTLELTGASQKGLTFGREYPAAEIILTKAMKLSGTKSAGIYFNKHIELAGGKTRLASNANNIVTTLPTTTRESVLKMELSGSENTGLYFNSNDNANTFAVNNYELKSDNGTKNVLVYIQDGKVNLAAPVANSKANTITMQGGKENVGIYTITADDKLTTAAKIDIDNSDNSIGLFAKAAADVTNTGEISATGKSVKAIITQGSKIESSGAITVNGTALSATDGSVGLASMNGGNLIQTGATNITVGDSASIGLYADGKYKTTAAAAATALKVTGGTVTAKDGAFNTYAANSGTITLDGVTLNTEPKSLAFYTTDGGKIDFGTGSMNTANIKGGTDANSRGTAFLYKGAGATYTPFTPGAISAWAGANFANLNKLTLNMEQGSRLFIAQNVAMDLSGTAASGIAGALPGVTFTGSNDYKTFMLYLSKLTLDQDINLDDPLDAYNKLEISNSTIENSNSKTITGTTAGQVAIAQENDTTLDRTKVQLINHGTINLSGANSTAIYGKFAEIANKSTGTISVADGSAALYGTTDSKIENEGTINLGSNSVGIFSKGDTAAGYTVGTNTYKGSVVNSGTITSTGKAIGVTYNGDGSGATDTRVTNDTTGKINLAGEGSVGIYGLGSNYHILNKGEITLGDSSNISTNPNVGIYTAVESISIKNDTTGKITTGKESVGAYGYDIENAGDITVGDNGVAIYSKRKSTGPSTVTSTGNITVGNNDSTGIFLENGGNLNLTAGNLNVGNNSYGVVAIGNDSFNYTNNAAVNVSLGEGSTYFYSSNPTTNFTNNIALNTTNKRVYGISTAGTVTNSANFTLGDESVGILYTGTGTATNTANITVGKSDVDNQNYAIGMATKTGTVENAAGGTITVGSSGIGLFADGSNAKAINRGTINLNGDAAMGMYLDNGAQGTNYGTIIANGTAKEVIGVVVQNNAQLVNESSGVININSQDGYAFFKAKGGTVVNRGTITLGGGAKETYDPTSKPTSKTTGSVVINAPAGATPATTSITVAGVPQTIEQVVVNTPQGKTGPAPTSLGIYVDTLGGTNPISGNLGLVTTEADLILGNEAAKTTTSKNIIVSGSVLDPYNAMMAANPGVTWSAYAGALTWTATPLYANGDLGSVVLAKIPYTEFAGNEATPVAVTDTYNFLDGLEQRYGVEPVGSREKAVFDKLNEIGKNEKALFYQATDEMMGHQYANVQQRIQATGDILNKEFDYLRSQWQTVSKDSNKVKVFGTRGEYNTDTAGVIDYRSHAYGVAYVHEDETVKMGDTLGWYAGIVHNRFKFKDIGGSREEMLQGKVGLFKSVPFDDNNSLNWTISGDISVGYNKMHRRFLVVDEVFHAKGRYRTYGIGIKNEISKDFRLSESFNLKPYVALGLEYGRFSKIKEKSGEIRLDVKSKDYFSIRPEIGAELGFKQYFGRKTLRVGISVAYQNELGRVANGKNKARVAYTTADWFNIRGEKEDRRGNVKTDLNIGVDNQRIGVTGNIGYDTKGHNIRGGVGLRVIF
ncbi:autotransporter domain-containing protein [Fusobacterium pseudoperiodonticum]|uniref:Autotransporter domain-containing protein n=1 Tax=Fusobacterium pseudoperiodonticum TaxID=2663009 RepID=A0AAD0F478_9FUSO|nr:autotransporter-associated N-terminal domain-containing protein [Fusobacterium pseudoperiodonticum]ATV66624.1 autotransporter domain-containing protein [Fusobacterium pseudoperiodonticum]